MNLGNQPVEILIEDMYLLVVPSPQTNIDPEEERKRAQAAKLERLENAELLHMRGQAEVSSGVLLYRFISALDDRPYFRRLPTVAGSLGLSNRQNN
jgi:hypothetical protein